MDFAADFTAIDFETANRRPDSACQLAAVKVRGGQIVDKAMWMIRPDPFFFAGMNIRIHGITPARVEREPKFGEIWDDIAQQLGDDCLVAHNANFDLGVLLACLRRHRQRVPELQYTCTRAIARRTWPQRRRYGLKPLSDWMGIRFRHHDALEDSIACAKILLASGIDRCAKSLPDLETKLRLTRGTAGPWGKSGPAQVRRTPKRASKPQSHAVTKESGSSYRVCESTVDLQRLLVRADFIRPLSGQRIVFAGRLRTISQQDAELLAARSGGQCQGDVTAETSFVVMGASADNANTDTDVRAAAERLRRDGHEIRIVNEREFLRLIGSVKPDSHS